MGDDGAKVPKGDDDEVRPDGVQEAEGDDEAKIQPGDDDDEARPDGVQEAEGEDVRLEVPIHRVQEAGGEDVRLVPVVVVDPDRQVREEEEEEEADKHHVPVVVEEEAHLHADANRVPHSGASRRVPSYAKTIKRK